MSTESKVVPQIKLLTLSKPKLHVIDITTQSWEDSFFCPQREGVRAFPAELSQLLVSVVAHS